MNVSTVAVVGKDGACASAFFAGDVDGVVLAAGLVGALPLLDGAGCWATMFTDSRITTTKSGFNERMSFSFLIRLIHQTSYLAATGNLLPTPNAFSEIFKPGGACWRLYSLRSIMRTILSTSSLLKPRSLAICFTVFK